jgi:hypothetical protein
MDDDDVSVCSADVEEAAMLSDFLTSYRYVFFFAPVSYICICKRAIFT